LEINGTGVAVDIVTITINENKKETEMQYIAINEESLSRSAIVRPLGHQEKEYIDGMAPKESANCAIYYESYENCSPGYGIWYFGKVDSSGMNPENIQVDGHCQRAKQPEVNMNLRHTLERMTRPWQYNENGGVEWIIE
jgi:hypothetical protein